MLKEVSEGSGGGGGMCVWWGGRGYWIKKMLRIVLVYLSFGVSSTAAKSFPIH